MFATAQDFFYKGEGEGDKLNSNDPHRQPLRFETDPTDVTKGGGYAYKKWPVSNPGMHGPLVSVSRV